MKTTKEGNFRKEVDEKTIQSIELGLSKLEHEIENTLHYDDGTTTAIKHGFKKNLPYYKIGKFYINLIEEKEKEIEDFKKKNKDKTYRELIKQVKVGDFYKTSELWNLEREHDVLMSDRNSFLQAKTRKYRVKKAISLYRVFKELVTTPRTRFINKEMAKELDLQIRFLLNNELRPRQRMSKSDLLFQVPLQMITLRMTKVKTTGKFYSSEQFKRISKEFSDRLKELNLSFFMNIEISLESYEDEPFLCPHFHLVFTDYSLDGGCLIPIDLQPKSISKIFSTVCEKHTGKKAEVANPTTGNKWHLTHRPEDLDGYVFYGLPHRVKQATKHLYWYVSKPQLLSPGDYFLTDREEDLEDWFNNYRDEFFTIYKFHTMDRKRPPTLLGDDPYKTVAKHILMIGRIPNRRTSGILSKRVQNDYLKNLVPQGKEPTEEELQKVSQVLYEGAEKGLILDANNGFKWYGVIDQFEVHNKVKSIFI